MRHRLKHVKAFNSELELYWQILMHVSSFFLRVLEKKESQINSGNTNQFNTHFGEIIEISIESS